MSFLHTSAGWVSKPHMKELYSSISTPKALGCVQFDAMMLEMGATEILRVVSAKV